MFLVLFTLVIRKPHHKEKTFWFYSVPWVYYFNVELHLFLWHVYNQQCTCHVYNTSSCICVDASFFFLKYNLLNGLLILVRICLVCDHSAVTLINPIFSDIRNWASQFLLSIHFVLTSVFIAWYYYHLISLYCRLRICSLIIL